MRALLRPFMIRITALAALMPALWPPSAAQATWSIIIVDRESKEVAIGSATCLTNFNLRLRLPVVLVDVGAAAAQAAIDLNASNRILIWNQLQAGASPTDILTILENQDGAHQSRQYGIVDTRGRAATFTGSQNGAYANGLTGSFGTLVYSIQGNVITGQPVLDQAEAAILHTPGDIPEKLMAAMEAARDMGGDGRCSCAPSNPTGCGSPPPEFIKSAHVGFMIVARRGDTDGECTVNRGCASGSYFMRLGIPNQTETDPDPVDQMRELFDAWRIEMIGVPDAVASTVSITPNRLLNDGSSVATMRIAVKDWQGQAALGIADLSVEHDQDSGASCTIGPPVDLGGGSYEVQLTAGTVMGRDRLLVRVTDIGGKERFLIPSGTVRILNRRADLNSDGEVDLGDLMLLLQAYGISATGDINGDGETNLTDLAELLGNLVW